MADVDTPPRPRAVSAERDNRREPPRDDNHGDSDRSPSPQRRPRPSPSPRRTRSSSPRRTRSPTPRHSRSPSPQRTRSPSRRTRSPSPRRRRSPSPARRRSRSPASASPSSPPRRPREPADNRRGGRAAAAATERRSPPSHPSRRDDRAEGRPGGRGGDSYRPHPSSRRGPPSPRSRPRQQHAPPPPPPPKPRAPPPEPTEEEKQAAAKKEYERLLTMRSGGTYIPPARLRALQAQITDKTSKEYQRMAWEALKKSINGLINKVNVSNIRHIVPELFRENLARGRGLFCRSVMKAQAASLGFTPIYAAMAAIVNSKLPKVGELLGRRLVVQFRKGFKRNDKAVCRAVVVFVGHLVNQFVLGEMLVAQMLLLLLHRPTDDSVELAVALMTEVGAQLGEVNPTIAGAVFERFRNILYEAEIEKRTQYMVEVLFQVRKDGFRDHPAIKEELDLVPDEDQVTHQMDLDGEVDVQEGLNVFKFDPEWEQNEANWKKIRAQILGEDEDEDEDSEEDESDDEEEEEDDEQEKAQEIKDQSNTDLVNLRRTIYLTIMSSMDPEECVHKLMKINLPQGQEPELPSMIVECCSQEKTYSKFYGLIGERFAKINRMWTDLFEESFRKYYDTIHRYETNRLRNIARFFGHMFGSDAFGWHALSCIHLNEEETTSSSRIFIKILFQDISEEVGMPKLTQRMVDPELRPMLSGIFPPAQLENARKLRFSINYFTSIGMGALTEEMREDLVNLPKPAPPPAPASETGSESGTGSYYSDEYSDDDRSPSPRGRKVYRRARSYSSSRSRSYTPSRSRSRSLTPSRSRSRSPGRERYAARGRGRERSWSRSMSRSRSGGRDVRRPAGRPRSLSRDRGRSLTRSMSRSLSRSMSPPRRGRGQRRESINSRSSRSRSRGSPDRGRGKGKGVGRATRGRSYSDDDDYSRSRSRSYSRPRSPPPRRPRSLSPYSARMAMSAGASGYNNGGKGIPSRRKRRTSSVDSVEQGRLPRKRMRD